MTFSSSSSSTASAELTQFQNLLEEIKYTIANRLGSPYSTNPDLISFKSVASGSVILAGDIGVTSGGNANSVLGSAQGINSGTTAIGQFQMVGSSYVASGFTESSSSSINLPLVLGITIPVAAIFIVVVIVIIVKVRNNKNSILDSREVVKVENADNSPGGNRERSPHEDVIVEDNTANNLRIENKNDMKSTHHEAFS